MPGLLLKQGLLLILTETHGERFAATAELAATTAALGRPVAVLLRGAAAQSLGEPAAAKAFELLLELGAGISICQTAMAASGLTAADLPPGIEPLGMVAFLQGRQDWQTLIV